VVLLIAFCVIESRIAEPMFQLGLFRIRAFTAGSIAGLVVAIARGGLPACPGWLRVRLAADATALSPGGGATRGQGPVPGSDAWATAGGCRDPRLTTQVPSILSPRPRSRQERHTNSAGSAITRRQIAWITVTPCPGHA
jgi:hypothetical protein